MSTIGHRNNDFTLVLVLFVLLVIVLVTIDR